MQRTVFDFQTGLVTMVNLTADEIAAAQATSAAEAAAVPEVLTPAQFWMQLAIDGDEDASLVIIDTLPRPQQILALRARQYERGNELLIQLATALGKSSADIDAFFREAAEL
jgi:hypothetical protein